MMPLTDVQIANALESLPLWSRKGDSLLSQFVFGDFIEAFRFLTAVAFLAEKYHHHPVIHNVYNRVELQLSTHDAGNKITQKDIELANAISGLTKE